MARFVVKGVESTLTHWYVEADTLEEAKQLWEDNEEIRTDGKGILWDLTDIDDSYIDVSSIEPVESVIADVESRDFTKHPEEDQWATS